MGKKELSKTVYNFNMRNILTKPLGDTLGDYSKNIFTTDWIFNRFYEKLIVAVSFFWLLASIIMLLFKVMIFK